MPKGVYKRTKWHKKINSKCHKGQKCSEKSKKIARKMLQEQFGFKNRNWKGGKYKCKRSGYIFIYTPDHPRAKSRKYVFEHILIMEKHLGRYLRPKEVVHHINGIKDDNRLKNLKLFANKSEHGRFHMLNIKCPKCNHIFRRSTC